MPAQIWINRRNSDVLLRTEDGQEHHGPLRLTPAEGVTSLKIIVVATCGCKNPLIIEPIPDGGGTLLEIVSDG